MSTIDSMVHCEFRGPAEEGAELSLVEFIEALCELLPLRQTPPVHVLNCYLAAGEVERGMSGGLAWTPFQLSAEQYDEVLRELGRQPLDAPSSVCSEVQWEAWCTEKVLGVPADALLPKLEAFYRIEREWAQAAGVGDRDAEARLHVEYMRLSRTIDELIDEHGNR